MKRTLSLFTLIVTGALAEIHTSQINAQSAITTSSSMNSTAIEAKAVPLPKTSDPSTWDQAFEEVLPLDLIGLPGETEEAQREPASAQLGLHGDSLWIYVNVRDYHLYNTATEFNELTYRFGDTIEVFLTLNRSDDYREFHFSPQNQRLQLEWNEENRTRRTQGRLDIEKLFLPDPGILESFSDVKGDDWRLLIRIPVSVLNIEPGNDATVSVSICRYNYHADGSFTLSSTSPHTKADFHQVVDWIELALPTSGQ